MFGDLSYKEGFYKLFCSILKEKADHIREDCILQSMKIGIVVGEISGDNLAADLIRSLRQQHPNLTFEGILGPQLRAEGGKALYPMDRLSVMGIVEPLTRIPELFQIRKHLIRHFSENPPDIFIGVDSPDFNLGLERSLKKKGIKIVHYVSPSVWAWRQGRIHGIKKFVDLMLTLLPFEEKFYKQHQVPVCFTGHPMADQISFEADVTDARQQLNLSRHQPTIALLPGSREGELKYLAEIFLLTACRCLVLNPKLQFVVPLVSDAHVVRFTQLQQKIAPNLPIKIMKGNTRLAISAADAVLVTSGTATLEVMLHKKPMVVAYRMHPITYQIAKRVVKVPYIALPNLLAEECLVPEFIQAKAIPELLAPALLKFVNPSFDRGKLLRKFDEIHQALRKNASDTAAKAICEMMPPMGSDRNNQQSTLNGGTISK